MQLEIYQNLDSINKDDIEVLSKYDNEYLLQYLKDPFTFDVGIARDGNILGIGIIRVINEFKMLLNPNMTNFRKAKVIKMLLEEASKRSQCNEIIVEISKGGFHYEQLLVDHFDFQPTYGRVFRLEK